MPMLEGFPMVDQRTSVTTDHQISENGPKDCVPAAVCAVTMYLNGVKSVGGIYTPDGFKDAACGQGYVGFTGASQFINYCASLGVKLWSLDGDYAYLIEQAHKFLAAGKPVVFTQDDWIVDTSLQQFQGWTHVAAWYADGPGTLTSMDPWGGFLRMKSDAVWATLLRAKQIWIAEKLEENVQIDIHNPEIAKHFKEVKNPNGDIAWVCTDAGDPWNGKIIHGAMLTNYKSEGNRGLCGFDILGRPCSNEVYQGHDDSVQFYENGVRRWKNGVVRPAALYDGGPGQDPLIKVLETQIVKLKAGQNIPPALLSDMQQIKTIAGKY